MKKIPEFTIFRIYTPPKMTEIVKHLIKGTSYSIEIVSKDLSVILDLSPKEWKGLIKFLRLTKSQKSSPGNKESTGIIFIGDGKVGVQHGNLNQIYFRKDLQFFCMRKAKFFRFRDYCLTPSNIQKESCGIIK